MARTLPPHHTAPEEYDGEVPVFIIEPHLDLAVGIIAAVALLSLCVNILISDPGVAEGGLEMFVQLPRDVCAEAPDLFTI